MNFQSILVSVVLLKLCAGVASAQGDPDRTVLPITEPIYPVVTELDVRKTQAPPRFQVTAPRVRPMS
jgi:arylsulfatase